MFWQALALACIEVCAPADISLRPVAPLGDSQPPIIERSIAAPAAPTSPAYLSSPAKSMPSSAVSARSAASAGVGRNPQRQEVALPSRSLFSPIMADGAGSLQYPPLDLPLHLCQAGGSASLLEPCNGSIIPLWGARSPPISCPLRSVAVEMQKKSSDSVFIAKNLVTEAKNEYIIRCMDMPCCLSLLRSNAPAMQALPLIVKSISADAKGSGGAGSRVLKFTAGENYNGQVCSLKATFDHASHVNKRKRQRGLPSLSGHHQFS